MSNVGVLCVRWGCMNEAADTAGLCRKHKIKPGGPTFAEMLADCERTRDELAEALRAFLSEPNFAEHPADGDCGWCEETEEFCQCPAGKARACLSRYDAAKAGTG